MNYEGHEKQWKNWWKCVHSANAWNRKMVFSLWAVPMASIHSITRATILYILHDQRLTREIRTINNLFFFVELLRYHFNILRLLAVSCVGYRATWLWAVITILSQSTSSEALSKSHFLRTEKLKEWNGSTIPFDVFDYFIANFPRSRSSSHFLWYEAAVLSRFRIWKQKYTIM